MGPVDLAEEVLLERERELAALDSLLDAAGRGIGGVVLVEGPAGIGKTRLLMAARTRAEARGLRVLFARGSDLEHEFAHGLVRQLFEHVVSSEGEAVVAGIAGHVGGIFGETGRQHAQPGHGPSAAAVAHGLFWLVASLAERTPLLLAVDDAHWADEASLRFLHYLARRVEELPLAIVSSVRAAGADAGPELVARIATETAAVVLPLRVLSPTAAKQLVHSLVARECDDRLSEACYRATGGNPLLLRELAGALAESGAADRPHDVQGVERLVPKAVARHVLIRLARLPPAATALAHAVAVLGGEAEPRHAAAQAELDQYSAAAAIDALVAADILAPRRPLTFVHPLLREVIYAELPPGKRALAHGRAARLLVNAGVDPQRIASQLLLCEPAGASWAVQVLRAAARDAHTRGSAQSAVTYLARALAEPPAAAERGTVLVELGLAEAAAAQPAASEHLAAAFDLIADPVERARVAPEFAVALEHRSRPAEAVAVLEEAVDLLGDRAPALRMSLEAQSLVAANTFLQARQALRARVARARAQLPHLNSAEAAPLLAALAHEIAHRDGTAEEAAACAERGLAIGLGTALLWEGVVVVVATEALSRCDRLTRAVAVLDGLEAAARAHGATHVESAALTARAIALNRAGRLLEAEADARLALELAEDEPWGFLRPFKLALLAEALIEQDQLEQAGRLLTPAELARHEADQTIFQVVLHDVYARLLALQGRLHEALQEAQLVERAECDWDIRNPGWTSWRTTAALVHARLGNTELAAALVESELHAAHAFGAPRALGIALRTAGLLARESSIDRLREAVAVLECSEARLEHARALVELGAALRRAGHRTDARQPLTTGLELARACAAGALARRAQSELLAAGGRPQSRRGSGHEALTASELRLARMAAQGLTNREIAQTLYLSLKTVEMHLGRAYNKLGIHSRTQLAGVLEAGESTVR